MDAFTPLIALHALCALFVILLGPVQILRPRRDRAHRRLGTAWVAVMVVTCLTSLGIHPDGFNALHVLAIWTLVCMVIAVVAIRRRNVGTHRGFMVGSYIGTLIAFGFAVLAPGRAIMGLLRQDPLVALAALAATVAVIGAGLLLALREPPVADAREV
ncbi:DUF2306 domain-containing protein [Brachybacterium hainanense]|uniref:DUF2306 domain-containing protein n=1 Tax=Brachybacterium hainanense TaxID=1541174 RepID=A0ABV6R663_9MICO